MKLFEKAPTAHAEGGMRFLAGRPFSDPELAGRCHAVTLTKLAQPTTCWRRQTDSELGRGRHLGRRCERWVSGHIGVIADVLGAHLGLNLATSTPPSRAQDEHAAHH